MIGRFISDLLEWVRKFLIRFYFRQIHSIKNMLLQFLAAAAAELVS